MKFLSKLFSKHHQSLSRVRIQILSDLHLEIGQQYSTFEIPVTAPYLILAGDVGRLSDGEQFRDFLQRLVPRCKRIFLVLGNHEFYGLDYGTALQRAQALEQEQSLQGKVTLLHKTRWSDPDSDLTILGCTLWSAIPPAAHDIVKARINDFKKISGWSVEEHNKIHADELRWLRGQVEQIADDPGAVTRQLLVVTHHAPCLDGTSSPEHVGNPWTPAFATDLLSDGVWKRVQTWVFGHTHYSADFVRNGTRVVSNQRGYVLPGKVSASQAGKSKSHNIHQFDPQRTIEM